MAGSSDGKENGAVTEKTPTTKGKSTYVLLYSGLKEVNMRAAEWSHVMGVRGGGWRAVKF